MKHCIKRTAGRMLAVLLCLSLTACGGGEGASSGAGAPGKNEPVQIAQALSSTAVEPERSVKAFQDIASFLARRIDTWEETFRCVELTEEDRTAVLEYVDLLIREFDYEIVGSYHFDPAAEDPFGGNFLSGWWEICLGLTSVDTGREEHGRQTDVPCDIDLYGKKGELHLRFTDLFHTEDYGYRPSTHTGDRFRELAGQRAAEGFLLEDGRYRNEGDGVLSVEAGTHDEEGYGEAVILLNGEELLYSSRAGMGMEVYSDYPRDDYQLVIRDFLPNAADEYVRITLPTTLTGGEVFTLSDGLGKRGDSPVWVVCAPGDGDTMYSSAAPSARTGIDACTVRILQWDGKECVVYVAVEGTYELDPIKLEVLAAVPDYEIRSQDVFREGQAVELKVGDTLDLEYEGSRILHPNYETFEWRITSGQGAAIDGSGDECTVTAVSPGEIIVKCVYSYGKDEPDVLTGALRNENHTRTKLYYIRVIP